MYNKHYDGEGLLIGVGNKTVTTVSVRLTERELKLIKKYYPEKSLSYAIRSMIHAFPGNNVWRFYCNKNVMRKFWRKNVIQNRRIEKG